MSTSATVKLADGRAATDLLVTVVIPAYNAAEHIGKALESVLAQTHTSYEVIVINDGSPDSKALEKALQPYIGRIVYIQQENRGPSAARNAGIRRAQGTFLAFLDSDDIWEPGYLATQMSLFEKDARLDLVYCDSVYFGDCEKAGKSSMQLYPHRGRVTFENLMKREFLIYPSAAVVRKSVVVAAGLFDEELRRSEDFDLFLRIAHQKGKIAYCRKVLVRRLVHPASLSYTPDRMVEAEEVVLRKLDKTLDLTTWQRRLLHKRIVMPLAHLEVTRGSECVRQENCAGAVRAFERAYGLRPTPKLFLVLLGLRTAPRLTRRLVCVWYSFLSGLERFRSSFETLWSRL